MFKTENIVWKCVDKELVLDRPRVMGILNVTPDSFSDGGAYASESEAIARGMQMLDQGASIIDVGGESTRPGFTPVSVDEEAKRVLPVVKALAREGALVSVDTRHVEVASAAVRMGAKIVNDVSGFSDEKMVQLAAESGVGCVVMQAGLATVPRVGARRSVQLDTDAAARAREAEGMPESVEATSEDIPDSAEHEEKDKLHELMAAEEKGAQASHRGEDTGVGEPISHVSAAVARKGSGSRRYILPEEAPIMRSVMGYLGDRARELARAGVDRASIAIDPGAGFGKSVEEDIIIQRATAKLASLGHPLVCALSRKRFVGALGGGAVDARDATSIGMALAAAEAGARVLRVHDVAGTVQVLNGYWGVAHPVVRRAFIALGSNVGDRMSYLERACVRINDIPLTAIQGVSRAYESEPAYGIATAVANAVVEVRTELSPMVLLEKLLAIEDDLGRVRRAGEEGHGPRTIDCDLVWMEDEFHAGNKLTLPHKFLYERDFVLTPLEDLQNDPVRFLRNVGVDVVEDAKRIGRVASVLGEIAWE